MLVLKTKQKIDGVVDLFLVVIAVFIIVAGILKFSDVKTLFVSVLYVYAALNLAQYILTRKEKDYEGLYTALASTAVATVDLFISFNTVNVISVSIMAWVTMMSVIKFIKTDYYNDRKDRMYKLRIVSLVFFIVTGILVSLSLNYSANVQVLIIGYFFLIHGLLELIDPITKYLIGK